LLKLLNAFAQFPLIATKSRSAFVDMTLHTPGQEKCLSPIENCLWKPERVGPV